VSRDQKVQWLLGAALLLLMVSPLAAQQQGATVVTSPSIANSGDASGTITATGTFQLIWAAVPSNQKRAGCLVLNNAVNRQWVYFQGPGMTTPTAGNAATIKAASVPLEPASVVNAQGGFVSCSITGAGATLQDAVWITGTAADTYVAKQQ
jgi:hypothetical protein